MKKVLLITGTRPEAVKMAPVYRALRAKPGLEVKLVSTGQHRELSRQAYAAFGVTPDMDLDVMTPGQSLSRLTANLLIALEGTLTTERPDLILAHGDTTTCYASAVSAFYHGVPFFHVEAGLRTYRLDSPFPEEFNRQCVARLAHHHFAPTEAARAQLVSESIDPQAITVIGGTVQDAVEDIRARSASLGHEGAFASARRLALLTLHRREAGQSSLPATLRAIREAAIRNREVLFVFPVHPSPVVRQSAAEILGNCPNIRLTEPLAYPEFVSLMLRSELIVTDSGGVQEEAAYLGRRVLVLRDGSERSDGIEQGLTRIVGTRPDRIAAAIDATIAETLLTLPMGRALDPALGSESAGRRRRASDVVADKVEELCAL